MFLQQQTTKANGVVAEIRYRSERPPKAKEQLHSQTCRPCVAAGGRPALARLPGSAEVATLKTLLLLVGVLVVLPGPCCLWHHLAGPALLLLLLLRVLLQGRRAAAPLQGCVTGQSGRLTMKGGRGQYSSQHLGQGGVPCTHAATLSA
jgi:hypothetical protein